jgi:hypothetical protein
MENFEERYEPLLARRVPLEDVVLGRAYVIHARNGGIGVAVQEDGQLGYLLHRVKFGNHFLFVEYDWAQGPPFGTAIPLEAIGAEPPVDDTELLTWLAEQENAHRSQIDDAWATVLGTDVSLVPRPSKNEGS